MHFSTAYALAMATFCHLFVHRMQMQMQREPIQNDNATIWDNEEQQAYNDIVPLSHTELAL